MEIQQIHFNCHKYEIIHNATTSSFICMAINLYGRVISQTSILYANKKR